MRRRNLLWLVAIGLILSVPVGAQVYTFVTTNARVTNLLYVGSARANRVTIAGTATTVAPTVTATGTDTNVGISLVSKGTGAIALGAGLIHSVGASTAAAGSTAGDAAALPAGTAIVYPTTAADGTKGVILTATDQVTGRTLFIGNGVSTAVLKIYPPTGGTINGAAANVAFSTASGKGAIFTCLSGAGNTWLAW